MKRALITGITGQDGAYLSKLLLSEGYQVHGLVRRKADANFWRLDEMQIKDKIIFHTGDVTDLASICHVVSTVDPSEVYNLAAQSFVAASFDTPLSTFEINAVGTLNLLEAIRLHSSKYCRFYQASTSEMFGLADLEGQNEDTPFHPRSPYGVAKLAAHWATINYRETYGLYACAGILFNHESPYRGIEFVTRKITNGVARIAAGLDTHINLGNIDAIRDWGHAADYVQAMHMMLQRNQPDDYVIATGESHTVREVCEIAFDYIGHDYRNCVVIDDKLYRPCEVPILKGDPTKAKVKLGWEPTYTFERLIVDMLDADLSRYGLTRKEAKKYAADDR